MSKAPVWVEIFSWQSCDFLGDWRFPKVFDTHPILGTYKRLENLLSGDKPATIQKRTTSKRLPFYGNIDTRIRSRFDQEHKLPKEKRTLLSLRKFRVSARNMEVSAKALVTTNPGISCFLFALSSSPLLSDRGKCPNSHFAVTMLTYSLPDFDREKNTAQNETFCFRPRLVRSEISWATPIARGNETGHPTTRTHLFVWYAKASTCWPASPAYKLVNNETSGRELQKCVGVSTSK